MKPTENFLDGLGLVAIFLAVLIPIAAWTVFLVTKLSKPYESDKIPEWFTEWSEKQAVQQSNFVYMVAYDIGSLSAHALHDSVKSTPDECLRTNLNVVVENGHIYPFYRFMDSPGGRTNFGLECCYLVWTNVSGWSLAFGDLGEFPKRVKQLIDDPGTTGGGR